MPPPATRPPLATSPAPWRCCGQALDQQTATLGPDHPDLATTLNNLALMLEQIGDTDEAGRCYRRAYAIALAALGPDDPAVGVSHANLAAFYRAHGSSGDEVAGSMLAGLHDFPSVDEKLGTVIPATPLPAQVLPPPPPHTQRRHRHRERPGRPRSEPQAAPSRRRSRAAVIGTAVDPAGRSRVVDAATGRPAARGRRRAPKSRPRGPRRSQPRAPPSAPAPSSGASTPAAPAAPPEKVPAREAAAGCGRAREARCGRARNAPPPTSDATPRRVPEASPSASSPAAPPVSPRPACAGRCRRDAAPGAVSRSRTSAGAARSISTPAWRPRPMPSSAIDGRETAASCGWWIYGFGPTRRTGSAPIPGRRAALSRPASGRWRCWTPTGAVLQEEAFVIR